MLPLRFDRSASRLRRSSSVPSTVHTAHRIINGAKIFRYIVSKTVGFSEKRIDGDGFLMKFPDVAAAF
jgi:hypothetical protein